MSSIERNLKRKFATLSKTASPGFHLIVNSKGKRLCEIRHGKTWSFYDLASLTKILFTTSFFMRAVGEGSINLDAKVQSYLPWFPGSRAKVSHLLSHSAGLTWWLPLYKKVDSSLPIYQRWMQVQKILRANGVGSPKKPVYSDLDFLYLGFILERVYGKPLLEIFEEYKHWCGSLGATHFNLIGNKSKLSKSLYAPTERCPWRKKLLQGEVHDDNTWILGGVAPQAGLFGRAQDVESWALWMRQSLLQKKTRAHLLNSNVVSHFLKRAVPRSRGDWSLGFMMPGLQGSSAGDHFSKTSVGHTGFTGTSFWWDLEKDLFVILLSNRVCPSRANKEFVRMRGPIHNMIYEEIESL